MVRINAKRWNLNAEMTGIMGFSAGGSLSARAATLFNKRSYSPVDVKDSLSCRPAFAILIYPGVSRSGRRKESDP